ncbi:MAG: DUF3105 domain-containing protein [Chloroflexi bacterium]|nr:DUF3105 domain-containing protein [Chloroflexota bacterium]
MLNKRKPREASIRERAAKAKRRKRLMIGGGALVGILILGFAGYQLFGPKPPPTPSAPLVAGECTPIQSFASQGQAHMNPGDAPPNYSGTPPTSGLHHPTWQADGTISRQPADNLFLARGLHSLEHGRIVIYYNSLDATEIAALDNIARSERKVILAPWSGLKDKVALTAWTRLQTCNGVNEQAVRGFINAFRDRGPESVP